MYPHFMLVLSVAVLAPLFTSYAADDQFHEFEGNPVFETAAGGFDSFQVTNPQILFVNGMYHMYYGGAASNAIQVGLAQSPDGITWTRHPENPVFRCSDNMTGCTTGGIWSSYRVVPETVIYEDGIFKMWYSGSNQVVGAVHQLGYATSSDGVHWNPYYSNPIFPDLVVNAAQFVGLIHFDQLYYLYYRSGDDSNSIWVATSTDGVAWSPHTTNVVIPYNIDSVHYSGGRLIARENSYFGESTDGLTFTFSTEPSGYADDSPQTAIVIEGDLIRAWYIRLTGTSQYATGLYYATATTAVLPGGLNTQPTITLLGDNPLTISVGEEYVEPGCEANDVEDGDLVCEVDESDVVTSEEGTYTVYYSAMDSGGLSTSTTRAVVVESATSQASSVAFLHGFAASRLYKNDKDNEEEKIWDTSKEKDLRALKFSKKGESVHKDIYTRDILNEFRTSSGLFKVADGYQEWMDFMDSLVSDGVIREWKAIAYDWRLATDALITKGEDQGDGNISYLTGDQDVPHIIGTLESLADRSPTGKVTIITHSNGGLVAKNLLHYLEVSGHSLLEKIDTVVLVAAPQLGTPKALREMLHGTETLKHHTFRQVFENMPGVYGLLPSRHLVDLLEEPVFEFTEKSKHLRWFEDFEPTSIDTYSDMRAFLIGSLGARNEPGKAQIFIPNVLNELLLDGAQAMHTKIDLSDMPGHIHTVEVVGTGLWTARGVKYDAHTYKYKGKTIYQGLVEWLSNTKGDGTVLAVSAEGGNTDDTYYFGMDVYNGDKDTNYVHASILSADPVQELIRNNILNEESALPLYIKENNTGGSSFPRFELRAYSPVDLHLNRGTKHTGVLTDEQETEVGRYYEEELANSYYEEWVDVKYIGADFSQGGVDLTLDGTGKGTFTLVLDMYNGDNLDTTHTWTDIPVVTESLGAMVLGESQSPILMYDYDGDGEVDAELAPGDTFEVWGEHDASFEGLRTAVRDADMSRLLESWFLGRIVVAEKLYERGTKGAMYASEMILRTVIATADRQSGEKLPEADAAVIAGLAQEIVSTF